MERIKRGNLRAVEINKAKKRKLKYITIAVVLAVLLLLGIVIFVVRNTKNYESFELKGSVDLVGLDSSKVMSYKNGIIKIGRDGAETISADGKQIWNVSYNMKDPTADVNGNYVVIGDRGQKSVYIIDGAGVTNSIETIYPIVEVQVATQGVAAILMDNGTQDLISIYSMDASQPLADVTTLTAQDGFPISIALSDDGTKLVTSYIKVENDTVVSQVTFHNFGAVGQNHIDQLVGSWSFSEFVPKIEFITNDIVAVFTEKGLILYSMEEIPSEFMNENFSHEIKDIFYTSSYVGVVLEAETGTAKNQMIAYNTKGKKVLDSSLDVSYQKIIAGDEFLVFYDEDSCTVTDLKGNKIFDDEFRIAINKLLLGRKSQEFLGITDIGIDILEMVETKEE